MHLPERSRLPWTRAPRTRPRGPAKSDALLLAGFASLALLECALRPELSWRSAAVSFALMPLLLWRRARPLEVVALGFGATAALSLVQLSTGTGAPELYSTAFMLLLPHALARWGAGRELAWGAAIVVASATLGLIVERSGASDVVGSAAVLLASFALGAAGRFRESARQQELEQVQLRAREGLARDLHDTVAHHVSAIAIRAQAGLAMGARDPAAPVEALRVIEAEASRTLAEMRAMVRLLRRGEDPDRAPTPGVADLERLAGTTERGPAVEVTIDPELGDLPPALSAALYRLAQESVTNARRHARRATRVRVAVEAEADAVRLSVRDDGEPTDPHGPANVGYGLLGMRERAELLGGSFRAGPEAERGWTVTAVLPRELTES